MGTGMGMTTDVAGTGWRQEQVLQGWDEDGDKYSGYVLGWG